VVDLVNGYQHVPMHSANFQKKTIITPWAAVQQTHQGAAQSAVEHTQLSPSLRLNSLSEDFVLGRAENA